MRQLRAYEAAIEAAGSQLALARHIGRSQGTVWAWSQQAEPSISPSAVGKMVALTGGKFTAPDFRPDVFGFLEPIARILKDDKADDTIRLLAIEVVWRQIKPDAIVKHLTSQGYSRKKARDTADYITDNHIINEVAA